MPGVRPLEMKKLLSKFWNPEKNTVEGFKYATYFLTALMLLLIFVLPISMILAIYLIFFILRSVVSLRAAATHKIDEEKWVKYSGENSNAKRTYAVFYVILTIFVASIIFFYIKTDGLFGLTLTLLIAIITLPEFIREIVIIRRCQAESDR